MPKKRVPPITKKQWLKLEAKEARYSIKSALGKVGATRAFAIDKVARKGVSHKTDK